MSVSSLDKHVVKLKAMGVNQRGLRDLCGGIFTISKYIGVFPFNVTYDKIDRQYYSYFITPALMCVGVYVAYVNSEQFYELTNVTNQENLAIQALFVTYCGMFLLPLLSIVWLAVKMKRFAKVFQALLKIENVTLHKPKNNNRAITACLIVALIVMHYSSVVLFQKLALSPLSVLINLFFIVALLAVQQFTSVLILIRSQYDFLLSTLDQINAEKWTKCMEVLGSCCSAICDCYAPQLLLYFLSIFVFCVCNAFSFVVSIKVQRPITNALFFLFCICFESSSLWYILFNCRDSLMKAKKFDKMLYRMVINDDSKVLLRNKRIQIHFKGKRNEEFSAMGFFNFDYPLICSMVCSATTYIVILVQFS